MKPYLLSLGVGMLVGVIYALFQVRSPAPPVIALVGLLGILVGEQLPPLVKRWVDPVARQSWLHEQVKPHVFGELPRCAAPVALAAGSAEAARLDAAGESAAPAHPSKEPRHG
ncbi:XapX domain-containing protein, partial [Derxia gummosa]|uniref:XapX domain-containing protein n=1 Tax=Derxia gummosa DSM 723 TaxID=1121388 RepID=A0A8B6X7P9_9BURK